MSFEAALYGHLSHASVTAIAGDRIRPGIRKESETVPGISYQVVSFGENGSLEGRATTLRAIRVQIDLWALKHSDILALDAAVRARMDTPASSFRSTMLPSGIDDYEPETKLYRRMLEYSCWFTET